MRRDTSGIVPWSWYSRLVRGLAQRKGQGGPRRLLPAILELESRQLLSTFIVANNNASGTGSLAQAIDDANSNNQANTITFSSFFSTPQKITLGGSELELRNTSGTQTITGPAAGVTISGGGQSGVFEVDPGVTAMLSGLSITGGKVGESIGGGGLGNFGTTTLTDCTITGNSAVYRGGGVSDAGTGNLTLFDCTISRNSASYGGGVDNYGTGKVSLDGCTINGNLATNGGGVFNLGATYLNVSTLTGNSASAGGGGLYNGAASAAQPGFPHSDHAGH